MLVTVVANQMLTAVFAYVAQQVNPGLTVLHTLIFSCVTGALTGYWLRADARRAWRDALDQGYVSTRHASDDVLKIADDCPNRWLVVLYIELNPDLVGPL